ncbi:MAG TPA: homocysteine S-methyltransferase family protein, partial [Planctomycetaceae bacterium]|nr:homocysteine S-methyltransferase family protein [Planctomycetaceae bacterium]
MRPVNRIEPGTSNKSGAAGAPPGVYNIAMRTTTALRPSTLDLLHSLLAQRILLLDGPKGTLIQSLRLSEAEFRGEQFRDHPRDLRGCNDLLVLTRPEIVEDIHHAHLSAGSDIIQTNTFNATSISLSDYGLESQVYAINRAASELAKRVAAEFEAIAPDHPRFVAGSMGPTTKSLSVSPDVNNPAFRAATFDDVAAAYAEQVRGLVDGGVDLLIVETAFDTLNLKAALFAIDAFFEDRGTRLP